MSFISKGGRFESRKPKYKNRYLCADLLYFVDVDIASHHGVDGQCRDRTHTEFLDNVAAMRNDGRKTDIEPVGNLFVE